MMAPLGKNTAPHRRGAFAAVFAVAVIAGTIASRNGSATAGPDAAEERAARQRELGNEHHVTPNLAIEVTRMTHGFENRFFVPS